MIIGILGGTGKQGSALAKRFAMAGHHIFIGSRSAVKGAEMADKLNKTIQVDTIAGGDNLDACNADVIVLAVPFKGITNLLDPLLDHMENKIILDLTVNLIPGKFFKVAKENNLSSYEFLRDYLPGNVVACMKTISSHILDSDAALNEVDFQISTDEAALAIASKLSRDIGLQPVRVRGKFHAHTIERMVAMAIQLNKEYKGSHIGYSLSNLII